jgi:hypothetical protein
MGRMRSTGVFAGLLGILSAGLLFAQTPPAPSDTTEPAAQEAPKKDEGKKPALADVTRVSTEKALRSAAKEKSKQDDAKAEQEEEASDSGVTEFRPARPDEKEAPENPKVLGGKKKSKGGALKNVHGNVYGATDAAGTGSRTGAAAGASTSSGKTSIYVETERDRQNPSRP